ncbi:hypothetical protein [Metaclostridioides mangenotii]|uniref:ATP dependent DNA ligase n=1 Tax=Metaclostridioides mangenotii TaxID=1540 RepID=UPI002F3E4B49
MTSLIIAQYNEENELIYKGHVTLGVGLKKLNQYKYKASNPPIKYVLSGSGNKDAVWIEPTLVYTVEYMPNDRGSLRQPVLKGISVDKSPQSVKNIKKGSLIATLFYIMLTFKLSDLLKFKDK